MPLGSGAVAGTNYAMDTAMLASRLGFSRVVANSIDASSDRDFVAAFLHACAMTMVHLSRLSEDLIIFCGEEHGFFQLSDASSTGSSMMPQKKNPDPLELIRGKTGRAHRPSHRLDGDDEGAAERIQQGSAGRQGSGLRRGRQRGRRAGHARRRRRRARDLSATRRHGRGVRTAAGHRRRRLSRRQGHAVSRGARSGRRDGAPAAGRGARFRRADGCRNGSATARSSTNRCARSSRRRRRFARARPRNLLSRKLFRLRWPK